MTTLILLYIFVLVLRVEYGISHTINKRNSGFSSEDEFTKPSFARDGSINQRGISERVAAPLSLNNRLKEPYPSPLPLKFPTFSRNNVINPPSPKLDFEENNVTPKSFLPEPAKIKDCSKDTKTYCNTVNGYPRYYVDSLLKSELVDWNYFGVDLLESEVSTANTPVSKEDLTRSTSMRKPMESVMLTKLVPTRSNDYWSYATENKDDSAMPVKQEIPQIPAITIR